MRVNLQPAYVLHSRPYRDTSALLEVFTAEHGRLCLVARGVRRRSRKGSAAALLQPFYPLLLSFSGRAELKTLTASEAAGRVFTLRGKWLYSGIYINELLIRLLHRHDAHPTLFAAYGEVVQQLSSESRPDSALRRFELTLLDELGYRFKLDVDGLSGQPVGASQWYRYDASFGLVLCEEPGDGSNPRYAGSDLLLMAAGEFGGVARLAARCLLRQALAVHLGDAPLHSRDLFLSAKIGRTESGG